MNFLKKSIYAVSLVGMAGLWSCSQDEMLQSGNQTVDGQTVRLTLTVNRGDAQTRTVLTENNQNGGLTSEWEKGDILYVYNTNGDKVGSLAIESGWDSPVGVFSGTVEGVKDGEYVSLFHHNLIDGMVSEVVDDNAKYLKIDLSEQSFSSVGDLAELDILTSADPTEENPSDIASVQLSVKEDGTATVMKDVTLKSKLAFARFSLSGLDEGSKGDLYITDVDGNLYVNTGLAFGNTSRVSDSKSADGMKIANVEAGKDVFVAFVPNARADVKGYTLKLRFVNDSDGKEYTYQFENPTTIEAGKYYNSFDKSEGSISGIHVSMVPETSTEPVTPVVDDLVGPAIKIGEKYYRFVKGNLYCDILDKDNYTWHLYDRETDYQLKAGTSSLNVTKTSTSYVRQINGTWKGSSNPANVNADNHYIDLFAWGATGLGTGDYKAKLPDIIRKGVASENTTTSYTGAYWPSDVTNTMDVNGNANIMDLWKGYSFTEPVYDFGYAYMQNGRHEGDDRTYVTAPLEAYAYICDESRSFSQGCIVKGANYDGKADAKGALILYGITDINDAKAAIAIVGGTVKSGFKALTPNKPKSGFTYLIELPSYESLQALNDVKEVNGKAVSIQAMFFASGGNGVYNFSSGVVNLNETDGAYWTSDGAKGSSTTANAYGFYFRNTSSATEFCWKSDASGVSSKRNTQRSVRLMVEVPAPDKQ